MLHAFTSHVQTELFGKLLAKLRQQIQTALRLNSFMCMEASSVAPRVTTTQSLFGVAHQHASCQVKGKLLAMPLVTSCQGR